MRLVSGVVVAPRFPRFWMMSDPWFALFLLLSRWLDYALIFTG